MCKQIVKSAIIPYRNKNGIIQILLGQADIGGYGYLGGTRENLESTRDTASREFAEECKMLFEPINVKKVLMQYPPIVLRVKGFIFNFYIIPWEELTSISMEEFIVQWNKTVIEGRKYNEKKRIGIVNIRNFNVMANTTRMIVSYLPSSIECKS